MNIIKRVLICLYLLLVILISLYLFLYRITNPSKTMVLVANNLKSFKDNDLIIIKKKTIKEQDNILFFNFYTNKFKILEGQVKNIEEVNNLKTYELYNNRFVSEKYLIGNVKDAKKIPKIGLIFKFLTSLWGYLLLALIPSLILFIIQFRQLLFLRGKNVKKTN